MSRRVVIFIRLVISFEEFCEGLSMERKIIVRGELDFRLLLFAQLITWDPAAPIYIRKPSYYPTSFISSENVNFQHTYTRFARTHAYTHIQHIADRDSAVAENQFVLGEFWACYNTVICNPPGMSGEFLDECSIERGEKRQEHGK